MDTAATIAGSLFAVSLCQQLGWNFSVGGNWQVMPRARKYRSAKVPALGPASNQHWRAN
jgi:hypothetical protein